MSGSGYEHRDAPPAIAWLGLALILGGLAVILGLVAALFIAFKDAAPVRVANPGPPTPTPVLETRTGQAMAAVQARAAKSSSYSWASADRQTARIPIDRAMQITAQRGWSDAQEGGKP